MKETDGILVMLQDIKGMLMFIASMIFFAALLLLWDAPAAKACAVAGLIFSLAKVRKYYDLHKVIKSESEKAAPTAPNSSAAKE